MKGVILAAGKGTRLYPVTQTIAKPLLPLANRPTLFYAFDRLKEMGVLDIGVVVGENENQMREALGDGSQSGVRLTFIRQSEPHGLAHAVGFAREFVAGDPFVLYLGDALYGSGFQVQARRFLDSGCANLNVVKPVDDPRRFGVASVDGERIVKLVEKPQQPESNLAMAGLYFFGPEIWDVLPHVAPSARGEYEITDAIQLLIDRGDTVLAGIYDGVWFDTGTLDSFLASSAFITDGGRLIGEFAHVDADMGHQIVVGPGARVDASYLEDVVILPGSIVKASGSIRHCLIGGNIEADGDLENQILFGG